MALTLDKLNKKSGTAKAGAGKAKEPAPAAGVSKAKSRAPKARKPAPAARATEPAAVARQAADPHEIPASGPAASAAPKQPVRPWSDRGLAKMGKSRRVRGDSHMTEEWMNLQEAPLFWVDLNEDSTLSRIQDKLTKIEEKYMTLTRIPKDCLGKVKATVRQAVFGRFRRA